MRKLILLFLLISKFSFAQNEREIIINFNNTFEGEKIECEEKYYHFSSGDSILFETIRYYISSILFYKNQELIFSEKYSFHLVDAADSNSTKIRIITNAKSDFDSLSFSLGIDSTTNVAGVMGGDLDPVKGMYWTWQSGYINFKLEGKSNLCNSRKHEFQFHLGGYMQPFVALQKTGFAIKNSAAVSIELPFEKFNHCVNLPLENSVMEPCWTANVIAERIAKLFFVQK